MQQSILELLQVGGPVVAILAALSVLSLAIILVKLWQFRSCRLGDRRTAQEALWLYRGGRAAEALARLQGARNPPARALASAIRGCQLGLPEARVREEVARLADEMVETLRGWLRPLELVASLAPLLGLFGTVLGMIEAFREMEQAGHRVDPSVLSGGIWEALLTTAVGLAVAIPLVAVVTWLERSVEQAALAIDGAVTQAFTDDLSLPQETESHELRVGAPLAASAE